MKCPHCNQEPPDNYQFCPITGNEIELLKACPNSKCPEFGRIIIPARFRFCPYCVYEFVESADFKSDRFVGDTDSSFNDDNNELLSIPNGESENITKKKRHVVTIISINSHNEWRTIKAIQGFCECSLPEAKNYINNLPFEIVCMAEDVNFIQNTFKELGATVQLREYIEDDEDEMITCPNCESENIIDDGSGYLQYTCGDCGCIFGNRNDVKCPKCDSNDIWDDGNEFENHFTCNNCGHEWDEDAVAEE